MSTHNRVETNDVGPNVNLAINSFCDKIFANTFLIVSYGQLPDNCEIVIFPPCWYVLEPKK